MKAFKYSILLILVVLISCEDVLEIKPIDRIAENVVWNDPVMVQAYVTNLYARFPFDAFNQGGWYCWTDEGTTSTGNSSIVTLGNINRNSEAAGYWNYTYIRDCNIFLERIGSSNIDQSLKKQLEGEVRFIRAYAYFEKMRRYGGVPLVDVVIDPFKPIDDKYLVRAKEEDIADFIDRECTIAIGLLSEGTTPRGKINKWTAFALQARANLWAGSIAKFSTVDLNGTVGIPSAKANTYFKKASDAANAVINSGRYSLYNAFPANKEENFRNIFVTESHNELIFIRPYDGVNFGHFWDANMAPNQWSVRGGMGNPTLDFILRFENADGSADAPIFGQNALYDEGRGPFSKKDPRLFASVFFEGDAWGNGKVQTYEGLDPSINPTPSAIIRNPMLTHQGVRTSGLDSRSQTKDDYSTNSGFLIKKYVENVTIGIPEGQSKTNWIIFRLAEMYLTKAEADFEMGNLNDAAIALNATRQRAGISLVSQANITREIIRTERSSELAFEVHRYWDLRRWRTAADVLNRTLRGLQIILHFPTMKYYFIPFNCETFSRVFRPEHYYNPITTSRINNNPKLIENPSY
jgi:hypothetical protein